MKLQLNSFYGFTGAVNSKWQAKDIHSSPVKVRYGCLSWVQRCTFEIVVLCVISCHIVPRYGEPIFTKNTYVAGEITLTNMGKVSNYQATTRQTVVIIHYNDVIMGAMASQITSLTIGYSTVYSRRRSKKTSKLRVTGLCVCGFPRWPANSPHKWPVTQKMSIWWHHHVLRWIVSPGKFPTRRPLHISIAEHENWINQSPVRINHLSHAGWKKILLWRTTRVTRMMVLLYAMIIPEYFQRKFSVRDHI